MNTKNMLKGLADHLDDLRQRRGRRDLHKAALAWLQKHPEELRPALEELAVQAALRSVDRRERKRGAAAAESQLELAGIACPRVIEGRPATEATLASLEAAIAKLTTRDAAKGRALKQLQDLVRRMKAAGLPDTASVADLIRVTEGGEGK